MANIVTILAFDEARNKAKVQYQDNVTGVTYVIGIPLPEDYVDENELLDYFAKQWPYATFEKLAKAPGGRNVEIKKLVGLSRDITTKVEAGP
jgi:hypothetical protein